MSARGRRASSRPPRASTSGCSTCAGGLGRRFGGLGAAVPAPSLLLEVAPAPKLTAHGPGRRPGRPSSPSGSSRLPSARGRGPAHRTPGHPEPQRARLGHPARAGRGPRPGRAARAVPGPGGAGAGGRPGPTIGHRHLDVRPGRIHRGGGPAKRRRGESPRCWRATPFPRAGAASWRCPPARPGLSGDAEAAAFEQLPPPPEREVERVAHLVLMQLLPALVEADLGSFGAALIRQCSGSPARGSRPSRAASSPRDPPRRLVGRHGGVGCRRRGPELLGTGGLRPGGSEAAARELAARSRDAWRRREGFSRAALPLRGPGSGRGRSAVTPD